jgi:hypothetical protein
VHSVFSDWGWGGEEREPTAQGLFIVMLVVLASWRGQCACFLYVHVTQGCACSHLGRCVYREGIVPLPGAHLDSSMLLPSVCMLPKVLLTLTVSDFFSAKTAGVGPVVCLSISNSGHVVFPRNLGLVGRCTTGKFRPADPVKCSCWLHCVLSASRI